eukprot:CAMPEP_0184690294 /NCGR_PEP_ID=MMETSP0312-20130426/31142_1 /TAXON_ID=31354 /ORGANISM="Compsopogon coeruleus, Strain SAG 36.94" /LENGTH=350 /DNA_ID=CAMNT_0027147763 /DNA_START=899 /DNA_END=1948 /DNA_ORIENTATION=-
MTIVISIHQPGRRLSEMADQILLLSDGEVAYFGSPKDAKGYFEISCKTEAPKRTSLADWMMRLVSKESLPKRWSESSRQCELNEQVRTLLGQRSNPPPKVSMRFHRQFSFLLRRETIFLARSPGIFWWRIVLLTLLALLFGAVWYKIGDDRMRAEEKSAEIWFMVSVFLFVPSAAVPALIEEKRAATREYADGRWCMSAFAAAHFLAELPFLLLATVIPGTVMYWMISLRSGAGRFVYFLGALYSGFIAAEALVFFFASVSSQMLTGVALAVMCNGCFVLLGGIPRPIPNIGWWFRWLEYCVNFQYWTVASMMKNEFDGVLILANVLGFPPRPPLFGDAYLDYLGYPSTW